MISTVSTLLKESDDSKRKWADKVQADDFKKHRPRVAENSRMVEIKAGATKHEKKLMSGIIESDKINTTFDDVYAPYGYDRGPTDTDDSVTDTT